MFLLGDNLYNLQCGLPPEQSRDDPAGRKVSAAFLLYLALYPSPQKPPPIKESFNIHQRGNLAPTLSLPSLTCFDAEAPPSYLKKKRRKKSGRSCPRKFKKKMKKKRSVGRHRKGCWRRLSQTKCAASKWLSDLLRFQRQHSCQQVCGARHHCQCYPDTIARFTR